MPNSKKTSVSTRKRVHFQTFLESLASVVATAPMFLLVLALFLSKYLPNRGNSEKTNHMHSVTSQNELEVLAKFLNMKSCKIAVPEGPVTQVHKSLITPINRKKTSKFCTRVLIVCIAKCFLFNSLEINTHRNWQNCTLTAKSNQKVILFSQVFVRKKLPNSLIEKFSEAIFLKFFLE